MRLATPSDRVPLGLAVLAFLVWGGFAAWHANVQAADYYVFWTAGRHADAPYDPAIITQLRATYHIDGSLPFVYPPTFLLLAWPFAQLPLTLAYPLWTGFLAAAFFYATAQIVRPSWATIGLFIVPPVVLAIAPGQTSLLVGAAMISGWLALRRRPILAGILFAIAACIKPQAMILAPILLRGHWRSLRWSLIAGLSLVIASFVFGPGLWLQWPRALVAFMHVAPGTNRINPSALFDGPWLAALLAPVGVYISVHSRDVTGLILGSLCLTPYAHQYDLAPLAPVAAAWLTQPRRFGWGRAGLGAALLAGAVATPAAALAFLIGFDVLLSKWPAPDRRLRVRGPEQTAERLGPLTSPAS